ncbi:autotransporter outer membrane beta-barrel domain-containing protein [Actinobacillus equuli subsp. equuli]|uniref:autotransporter outer membrane beta-barrel domain-containing protein n=1 Tax=Actinobacillus equuli TaxID=718 RepID=UPI00244304C1|nr:autotransporter outer membrane beta-barrel domain-containing protein [Actinobacillus equuli]WGE55058.1 autotransporter outer membrane beta-barrel domain-containing protein [Actinobacillus equuli subsp. equuli]
MKFTKNRVALAILFGVPASSVLLTPQIVYAQSIIAVSDQASFEKALATAQNTPNTVIKLTTDFTLKPNVMNGHEVPWSIGNVVIDGENNRLSIRGSALALSGNAVIKNTKLSFVSSQELTLDLTAANQQEITQYIYVNGYRLELDNVDTQMGTNQNEYSRPTVVMGVGPNSGNDAGNAELVVKNTTLKRIIAGNMLPTEKTTNSMITLEQGTKVLGSVHFGGNNAITSGKVTVINKSPNVTQYDGSNSTDNTLNISGISGENQKISKVKNLTLSNNSHLDIYNDLELDTLTLDKSSSLNTTQTNFPISVKNLAGDGKLVINGDIGELTLETTSGNPTIDIQGDWLDGDTKYVTVKDPQSNLTVTASQEFSLKYVLKEGNSYKLTNKQPTDPVSKITQKGSGLKVDEKPAADVPEITQKGSSLKADEKPAADVPEITQKGSSLKADEKPTAGVPEITQKGSSLKVDEKPTAGVPEITQKGSSLKVDEKPTADVPEITQKGSSLKADEKPAADTPEISQKGSTLKADEKSAADVPETTQKGTSATAEEKPVVEPVVQQTLAGLTVEKPEVDTEALIAALHRAEMLLQQQQKTQQISNLVESNAAAQLNSIADVNMDIAQQVIEKFPTDGNQFRVWSNNTVTNSSAYRNTQQHYETESFRSQLGVSGLVNANTQVGAILTDVRNSNDFAYNSGKHHLQIASAFVKYQTNNGTFAAFDLGAGRIKNKLKSANQTDSFSRKLVQTGLTLGQELTWNQLEATVKTGIRYNHLGHANYQLDELNVQEQAVDFVSYFAGLELGYKFALGTQFSVKPLISAEYWVHNGNAEIKVADREFSLETGNRQHFAAGVEMGYQNLKLSLSAGVTDGSKVAKQNVAKLNLNYQF